MNPKGRLQKSPQFAEVADVYCAIRIQAARGEGFRIVIAAWCGKNLRKFVGHTDAGMTLGHLLTMVLPTFLVSMVYSLRNK